MTQNTSKPIAFVTGASGGIGRVTADLLEKDYDVVRGYYKHPIDGGMPIDVTSMVSVLDVLDNLPSVPALWVNCAGILRQKPHENILKSEWDYVMDVNAYGTFLCCQRVLPLMIKHGGGCIINVASSGGQVGGTLGVHYAASKAVVISLTKSYARLGAPTVRVNAVSPGLISTRMSENEIASQAGLTKVVRDILMQRVGTALEVAHAIAWLAENQYMTGQIVNVNGGLFMG